MKYFIILFTFFSMTAKAQSVLQFDKRNVDCEDKWVTYQMAKDSTYHFGFIYIDDMAGLTFHSGGQFTIAENGDFNVVPSDIDPNLVTLKSRLEPSRLAIAEIPESKFADLNISKTPDWLHIYKNGADSAAYLFRRGYLYNAWSMPKKALTFLEKARDINADYEGLQTELAFSYNALGFFNKAETALTKALATDANNCYTLKELAFTYTKLSKFDKVKTTYKRMVKACDTKAFCLETAYNLCYEYYKLKDLKRLKLWKAEAEKWIRTKNQYSVNLDTMLAELEAQKSAN